MGLMRSMSSSFLFINFKCLDLNFSGIPSSSQGSGCALMPFKLHIKEISFILFFSRKCVLAKVLVQPALMCVMYNQ